MPSNLPLDEAYLTAIWLETLLYGEHPMFSLTLTTFRDELIMLNLHPFHSHHTP